MVRMAYQRKVQPIGLTPNFKIDLASSTFKISITIVYVDGRYSKSLFDVLKETMAEVS
jgi:hypothetical protein